MRTHRLIATAFVALAFCACAGASKEQVLAADASQVQLRTIQTRAFDTADREKMLRTVIATLQDLSFVIDKADEPLAAVSATKLDGYRLRMTVTVRARGDNQLLVRANAEFGESAIEDPIPYRDFFAALSKALFLEAQQVD
jgi:hypothetical protein